MMSDFKFNIGDTVRITNMQAATEYWGTDPTVRQGKEFVITQRFSSMRDGNVYSRIGYGWIQEKNLELVKEEKPMKKHFEIGDWVRVKKEYDDSHVVKYGGKVFKIEEYRPGAGDLIEEAFSCKAFDHWIPVQYLEPVPQKILVMQDEKDPNRVFARNMLTGEQAEAKCAPGDDFDFNKGAALAFERLTKQKKEPEKPKDDRPLLNGKFVCVEYKAINGGYIFDFFTVGKVYEVKNGVVISNTGRPGGYNPDKPARSIDELNNLHKSPIVLKFIEYKGEN